MNAFRVGYNEQGGLNTIVSACHHFVVLPSYHLRCTGSRRRHNPTVGASTTWPFLERRLIPWERERERETERLHGEERKLHPLISEVRLRSVQNRRISPSPGLAYIDDMSTAWRQCWRPRVSFWVHVSAHIQLGSIGSCKIPDTRGPEHHHHQQLSHVLTWLLVNSS